MYVNMYIYKIVLMSIKLICSIFKVKFLCTLLSLECASLSTVVQSISLNDLIVTPLKLIA